MPEPIIPTPSDGGGTATPPANEPAGGGAPADGGAEDLSTPITSEELAKTVSRSSLGPRARAGAPVTPKAAATAAPKDGETPAAGAEEPAPAVGEAGKTAPAATTEPAKPATTEPAKPAAAAPEPPDFSITVEDADGVTHKLESIDDLPDDFVPKNNKQAMHILDQLRNKASERKDWEGNQKAEADKAAQQQAIADIQTGWQSEIKQLQGDKRLPVTADGKPSEREQQVVQFMAEVNDAREKTGQPFITSIEDALDKLEAKEARESKTEAAKEAKQTARTNGALVGGSSAPAGGTPAVYRAGSARNAREASRQMNVK